MNIYLFSNTKNVEKSFAGAVKNKKFVLHSAPADELKKTMKIIPKNSIVYVDISSLRTPEIPPTLKLLAKLGDSPCGIIDPKGTVTDIAELFHNGVSDYITLPVLKKGVTQKRLERIMKLKGIEAPVDKMKELKKNYILTGGDWSNVKLGKEYTFCFMMVELDNKSELKSLGPEKFGKITASMHQYLEAMVAPLKGKIWIRMDYGGLVLFPFDGKRCDAIEAAFRLMINRKLMSAELIRLDINLSYRVAIHIGNTEYQTTGDTGTIVSDTINSVFHLCQKYTEPGSFYLTEDIFILAPKGMKSLFLPAGTFEGRNILRMRHIR